MNAHSELPPLRRQATWVVGWRIVGILATLVVNILAARVLGPADFGIYLVITTVMALGALLGMAGLNEAGLRFVAESLGLDQPALARAYLRRVLLAARITSLLAAVAVGGGMILLERQFAHFHLSYVVAVLTGLGVIFLAWQQIAAETLRGFGNLRWASVFSGGQTGGPLSNLLLLAGLAGAAWLVTVDAVLAIGLTVASVVATLPLALLNLWRTNRTSAATIDEPVGLSPEQSRMLLTVGGVLAFNQLLAFGSQQMDIWLGGALLAPETLGLYGAAKRSLLLAAMPVQMAMMTVLSVIPRLHAQQRTRALERVLRSAATYAAIPSLAALLLLGLFPEPILRLAFGGSYTGAAPTVLVLVLGWLVLVLTGNAPCVLAMTGRHRTVLVVNFAAILVLLVVGTVGATFFGAPGLAAGSAASIAFQNGTLWWLAHRKVGVWTHVGFPTISTSLDEASAAAPFATPCCGATVGLPETVGNV